MWWHRCMLMQSNTTPHCTGAGSHSHPALRLVYRQVSSCWQFSHKCQRVSITLTTRRAAAAASLHSWAAARYENLLFPPSLTCTHHINPMNLCIIFLLTIERLQPKMFSLWQHGCLSSISTVSLSNQKCSTQNSGKLALGLKYNNPISAHQGVITRLGLL